MLYSFIKYDIDEKIYCVTIWLLRKPRAANHLLFLFIYDTLLTLSKY